MIGASKSQLIKTLCFGLITLLIFFILSQLNFANHFPIKTVKIYGVKRIDTQEMRVVLFPLVSHGFFNINVDYIKDRLLQMPWISDLYVRRIWPDQVEVTVIEKKPIAYWNNENLLSQKGELFKPKQDISSLNLAKLIGPTGKHIFMLNHFNNMNRLLLPIHAKISYMELTSYANWQLILDNGMTMTLGDKDVLTRLHYFVKVYPKIIGSRAKDVDYIDLRYPNGIAVRWLDQRSNTHSVNGKKRYGKEASK